MSTAPMPLTGKSRFISSSKTYLAASKPEAEMMHDEEEMCWFSVKWKADALR